MESRCIECEEIELARVRDERPQQTMPVPYAALDGFPAGRTPRDLTRRRLLQWGVAGHGVDLRRPGARLGARSGSRSRQRADEAAEEKCLVLLYLAGGNDGLNVHRARTTPPTTAAYVAARPMIHRGQGAHARPDARRLQAAARPGRRRARVRQRHRLQERRRRQLATRASTSPPAARPTAWTRCSATAPAARARTWRSCPRSTPSSTTSATSTTRTSGSRPATTRTSRRAGSAAGSTATARTTTRCRRSRSTRRCRRRSARTAKPVCAIPSLPMSGFTHNSSRASAAQRPQPQHRRCATSPALQAGAGNAYLSRSRSTYGLAVETRTSGSRR